MPYNKIRPIDRSYGSYRPGHQVHWIQAKKSMEEQQPVIYVSAVVHDDGQIDIEGHDLSLELWNHDPPRLRSALGYRARVVWKPRYHVAECVWLRIQHGRSGRTNGLPAEGRAATQLDTTVDRVLWEARTYGGLAGVNESEGRRATQGHDDRMNDPV